MHERNDRPTFFATAALAILGVLSVAATRLFQPWHLIAVCAAVLIAPIGERLDQRFRFYRKLTLFVTALFTIGLPLWFAIWGIYRGVVGLVIFILVHKFVHKKLPKDYYQIVLMSFALLLAAGSHQPSAGIAPVLVGFLACAVLALMGIPSLYHVRPQDNISIFGYTTVDISSSRRQRRTRHENRLSLLRWGIPLFGFSLFMTVGLFLLIPRIEAGLIQFKESNTSTTGADTLIELAEMGPIIPDTSIIMRVRFPEENRGLYPGNLYWRVTAYNEVVGSRWERAAISSAWSQGSDGERFFRQDENTIARTGTRRGSRRIYQRITLDKPLRIGLPCLAMPVRVRCTTSKVNWDPQNDYTVLPSEIGRALEYEVWSDVPNFSPEELRKTPTAYTEISTRDYNLLTRHTLSPQAIQMALRVTEGHPTVYDKVTALEQWFRSDVFQYSFDPPRVSGANQVNLFLLETRTGNCQHFASAMAMMVRSLGIPARVVSGFRGGDWDDATRTLFVRQDTAHLWVEVYFIGYGWVPFDPTPSTDELLQRTRRNVWWTNRFMLWLQYAWYRNVEGYRTTFIWRALTAATTWLAATRFGIPAFGFAFLACVCVLVSWAWIRRVRWHTARVHSGDAGPGEVTPDQRRAARLYRKLKKELGRVGVSCEGKTATELVNEAAQLENVATDVLRDLVSVYLHARFGGATLPPNDYSKWLRRVKLVRISQ